MISHDISFVTVSDVIANTILINERFSYSLDYIAMIQVEGKDELQVKGQNSVLKDYIRQVLKINIKLSCPQQSNANFGISLLLFYRSEINDSDELQLFKRIITQELNPSEKVVDICRCISYSQPDTQVYQNLQDHDVTEGVVKETKLELPSREKYHSNVVTFIVVGERNIKEIRSFPRYFENEIEIKKVEYFGCEFYVVLEVDQLLCCYCPYESDIAFVENQESTE